VLKLPELPPVAVFGQLPPPLELLLEDDELLLELLDEELELELLDELDELLELLLEEELEEPPTTP
jgi:hypothetical protein